MNERTEGMTSKLKAHRNLIWVLLAGLAVRCVALLNTYIVNQDGPLYIYQAQAVYTGNVKALAGCGGLHSLTSYPLLIAALFPVTGDWIVSARVVSLLFGAAMLVPVYFLARRFFDPPTDWLVTLLYALLPVFVGRSADVVRDPVFWFFAALGLWLFIEEIGAPGGLRTVLSAAAFFLAFWTRLEGLVMVLVSLLFLCFFEPRSRLRKLLLFLSPFAAGGLIAAAVAVFGLLGPDSLFRFADIVKKPAELVSGYGALQNELQGLADYATRPDLYSFLSVAKDHIWVVALGAVLVHGLEAFFYPYLLFLFAGAGPFFSRARHDPASRYLVLLLGVSFVALVVHLGHVWVIDNRFLAILVIPAFAPLGIGIERLSRWMTERFSLTTTATICLIVVYAAGSALSIDLRTREKDKAVFPEIGRTIASLNKSGEKVTVATSKATQRWISFYANRGITDEACGFSCRSCYDKWPDGYDAFERTLERKGGDFFLYEQKRWPKRRFDFKQLVKRQGFVEIGRWQHPDTGTMILYRIR